MTRRFQGLNAWILQRASAVYLAIFFVYLVFYFTLSPPANFGEWRTWVADPINSIFIIIFMALLIGHIWVGLRDVFMDYVSSLSLRALLLFTLAIGLLGIGIWFARIIILVMIK